MEDFGFEVAALESLVRKMTLLEQVLSADLRIDFVS